MVDAVFARAADRDAIEDVAAAARVPFLGVWLDAPEQILVERSQHRRADPSDADPSVVRAQLALGAGEVRWTRVVASGGTEDVLRRATGILQGSMAGSPAAVGLSG